jgi:Zn-finger nucleic acid-binding protein
MLCPIDQTILQVTERERVEIDYCPTCRGVWLDRGELDKIIDRFAAERPAAASGYERGPEGGQRYGPPSRSLDDEAVRRRYAEQRVYRDDDDDDDRYKSRKRRGWLGDLFDF